MPTQAQVPPVLNISDRDLIRCSNTAPGPDGVRYSNWRKFDVGAQIIAVVLNCARRLKHTPKAWTTSVTILIHKKGSREDVSNWRPISLSNTIAKIHTSVLAERLGAWAARNHRLGESQKGFLQMDGCAEHNFVLQSIIADARKNRRQCCVAWLDLANAFGSIPHETIFQSLEWSGLSDNSIDVIRRLYENNTTSIRSSTGPTPAIHITSGVKQGCPLSPIIFNLAIEPILHAITASGGGYRLMGKKINSLAYADDMAIIAENPPDLQRLLDTTTEMANWAGLSFNTKKCATLHIDGRRKQAITTAFNIQGGEPAILGEHELYEHLGVPTGYHTANSADKVLQAMSRNLGKVDNSLLAPWQKCDAINTFVLPCLSFHLKNGVVPKTELSKLDRELKIAAKKWLNLPQRASVEPLYMSYKMGGVNLMPMNQMADISQITHAARLLDSATVGSLAKLLLQQSVTQRLRRDGTNSELAEYLNGSMAGDFKNESIDVTNTFTRLRTATTRLRRKHPNVEWISVDGKLKVSINKCTVNTRDVEASLKNLMRESYRQQLLAKPDQGKVYQVTPAATAPNHFMRSGDFTRFAEWRFVHRARLDCVPLKGARRHGNGDKRCRRCGHANETLPHVLNHCKPHFAAMTRRHDAVLNRITKAFKPPGDTVVKVNRTVPGFDDGLRPDLLITNINEKTMTLVDVAIAFENRYTAFEATRAEKLRKYKHIADDFIARGQPYAARLQRRSTVVDVAIAFENQYKAFEATRAEKLGKYQHIADDFIARGYDVHMDDFIIGSLGGWDPENERTLSRLGLGRRYCHLMRRLMCTETIRWSRDVYVEHVTGNRQYQEANRGDQ
ncbi:uncharacterized protein LOC125503125 [Dendroctonus ponderosae]|uniref:uncharacterized protein LOC125503125 n=1 Tax=Dendroctonus ponderosae TaxID=77166 RepID=UPI002034FB0B|nr:uncharacterized protein LOC125503125 [Dendroctonus ponderosae]